MEIKVAILEDQEKIFDFEKQKHQQAGLSDMEVTMKSWDEPWREESLAFYLKSGWCFVARDGDQLCGYLLAQPQLFMQAATQSLWVEYVSGRTSDIEEELLDVAYKWARSKHLQKVLFNEVHIPMGPLEAKIGKRHKFQSSYAHSTKVEGAN